MKLKLFYLSIFLLFFLNIIKAQTTILIYQENFEKGAPGVTLNTTGAGKNLGSNQWVINDKYNGSPLYPNTPSQDQTSSGTISYAPYGHYLHISDKNAESLPDTIFNCNYNPTNSSDRFVQLTSSTQGFCTVGITNVKMVFFYTGKGSSTAYAELYYSTENGPWISTGTVLNNQSIWKYEVVQNPAFDNKLNLRFGFRWINDSGSLPGNTSIGIDEIFIKGDFNNSNINFNVLIDSITPTSVCQNNIVTIYYSLSKSICGSGFCTVQLSDATGSFTNPTDLAIFQINNMSMSGSLKVTIPSNSEAGTCYKLRLKYNYAYYALDFITSSSVCFEVKHCPNTITTLQPLITKTADSVCVGSVIIVPFTSTGVFQTKNKYIAQLSDSSGNFSNTPNQLGAIPDSQTYDPATGAKPGSVSGMMTESKEHPVPNGCNYFIRVVSSDPSTIGTVWGPFCIKHCDIETNYTTSIQACLHSCETSNKGFNTIVYVKTHSFDSSAVYDPALNQFKIELLDASKFSVVSLGTIGKITADSSTNMKVHIPCADSLSSLGLSPGMYYMRIVATNSSHPYDIKGTLIFLTIGTPADKLTINHFPNDSAYCVGDAVGFYPLPYTPGPPMLSTYQWYMNGSPFSTASYLGILFQSAGTFNLTIQETNFGCKGPITPNSTKLYVYGTPSVSITGPGQTCLGDTLNYKISFQKEVYYEWSSSGGKIIDTSNNELSIRYDTEGSYVINILGLNRCGQAIGKKNILVTPHPDAKFTTISPVCTGVSSIIKSSGTTTPPLTYNWNFDGGIAVPGGNKPGPHKVTWKTAVPHKVKLIITKFGCATTSTSTVDVLQSPTAVFDFKNICLGNTTEFTNSSVGNLNSWKWNFGDKSPVTIQKSPTHMYSDTGKYSTQLIESAPNGCKDTLVKVVSIYQVPTSEFTTNPQICSLENSKIFYTGNAQSKANYIWDFSKGKIISGEGKGPYEVSWPGPGNYNIVLSISENGCSSNKTDTVDVKICDVKIHNVFSPNNDGKNDKFYIEGLENFPDSKLIIYTRWGNKIYESNDYQNDWDGEDKADGVYYYILYLNNGTSLKGTVSIIR